MLDKVSRWYVKNREKMCCLRVSFVYVEKKRAMRESSKREEQEYQALNNCLNEYSNNRKRFQRSVMISHI